MIWATAADEVSQHVQMKTRQAGPYYPPRPLAAPSGNQGKDDSKRHIVPPDMMISAIQVTASAREMNQAINDDHDAINVWN